MEPTLGSAIQMLWAKITSVYVIGRFDGLGRRYRNNEASGVPGPVPETTSLQGHIK